MGDEGGTALAAMLRRNSSLRSLDVSYNWLSFHSFAAFGRALVCVVVPPPPPPPPPPPVAAAAAVQIPYRVPYSNISLVCVCVLV